MSLTSRDKKIVIVLIPLVAVIGYWFLLLAPKREEAAKAKDELAKQEKRRDEAQAELNRLTAARKSFAGDYADLARLGKAIPSSVDMPSLMVQLDFAARGTGIKFTRIATGERDTTASSAPSTPPSGSGKGAGSQPRVAAGGAKAQTGYGSATESANNVSQTSNAANAKAEQKSGLSGSDTQTSTSSRQGGLPVGGGSTSPGGAGGSAGAGAPAGLETVPLELEFGGSFFRLADFFHRLKRFVRVVNSQVLVHGRLMTVDTLKFSSDPQTFPELKAEVTATVYLSPKAQGTTAGATPQGPAKTASASTSSGGSSSGSGATTPTATATP